MLFPGRMLAAAFLLASVVSGPALAADQMLDGKQTKAYLTGKRFTSEIWRRSGVVFLKNGKFRFGTRPACGKSDPHSYTIDRYGLVTIEYRSCEGRKKHTDWFYVIKSGRSYMLRAASAGFTLHLRQR